MNDNPPSTDGVDSPTGPTTVDVDTPITLSAVFEDGSVEVNSADKQAAVQVRPDHGEVRLEATETGERTFDAVLTGEPEAMATLADALYRAAATAAHDDVGDTQ